MNLKMRLASTILLLLLLVLPVFADDWSELIKNAPDASKFEDANGILLSSIKSYELATDNKKLEDVEFIIKVFNNNGRQKYSDQRIAFNTEKDTLTLVRAGTYRADHSFVEVEDKAINDVTPAELAGAEVYANYLHRVFSFPVVDPGTTLYMHYKRTQKLEDDNNISDWVFFQFDEPLLYKEIRIVLPAEKKLLYKSKGFDGKMEMEKKDDKCIYTMKVKNVLQVKSEERMPPFSELAQSLIFSTCASWNEAALPFSKKFYEACRVTPEIEREVKELVSKCKNSEEKIRAVSLFIAQKVRNVDIQLGSVGFTPHQAEEVLKNKYGDCRDKSVLMVTLLKACGVESYPALIISSYVPITKEVPTLEQFDSMLIAIPDKKGYLFLDPFGEMAQFGYVRTLLNSEALVMKPEGTEFSPVSGYSHIESKSVSAIEGTLSTEGDFKGRIVSRLTGGYDTSARYGLFHLRGKKLEMYFEQRAEEFCPETMPKDAERTDALDLLKNMEVSLSVSSPDLAILQGNMMVLRIPEAPFSFSRVYYSPSLPSRKYAYQLGSCNENRFSFKVKLPEGVRPLYMPKPIKITEGYGTFTLSCEFNENSRELLFSKDMKFTRNRIEVSEYSQFKKHLESLELTQNNLVILQK